MTGDTDPDLGYSIDARGSQGLYVGDGGVQLNLYDRPDAYELEPCTPDGRCLAEGGRPADALAAEEEAIALLGRLVPDGAALASALSDRSATLGRLGRLAEGAKSAFEALRIFRRLSGTDPQRYLPGLAQALTGYASLIAPPVSPLPRWGANLPDIGDEDMRPWEKRLSGGSGAAPMHRRNAALEAAKEAMGIYGDLAQADPDNYEPGYADSIARYGALAWPLGQRDAAVEHITRSIGMFRELARRNPDAFQPDLAYVLLMLAQVRSTGRTRKDADFYEQMQRGGPVVISLADQSVTSPLEPATDPAALAAALVTADEAVAIYAGLAARFPAVFTGRLEQARGIRADIVGWQRPKGQRYPRKKSKKSARRKPRR